MTYTVGCAVKLLEKKQGYYELIGADILLDEELNPYLLELNTNPALFLSTSKIHTNTKINIIGTSVQ